MARRLGTLLAPCGEVNYTIETEKHLYSEMTATGRSKNLDARTTKANQIYYQKAKQYGKGNVNIIFVSIHANAFSDPKASGYEIFIFKIGNEANKIAKHVHQAANNILGVGTSIKDRGIKEGNFAVLRNTQMPSILIEHEFFTNSEAAAKLKGINFRQLCAKHIKVGLLNYLDTLD